MGFIFRVPAPIVGVGYIAGGFSGAEYMSIDALDFATNSISLAAASLSIARDTGTSFKSSAKGFAFGGSTNSGSAQSISSVIDGVVFSTVTAFTSGASAAPLIGYAGVNSVDAGYVGGGIASGYPGPTTNTIRRYLFSTDAVSTLSATLATSRWYAVGLCTDTRGYFAHGMDQNNAKQSEIDGITYSTETAYNPTASVSSYTAFSTPTGVNSSTAGYIGGGTNLPAKFTFATESCVLGSTQLSNRVELTGVNSTARGYFCGGNTTALVDGIVFGTDAYFALAASLTTPRRRAFGFQSGTAL